MKSAIQQLLRQSLDVLQLNVSSVPVVRPDISSHGDYASPVAFQIAKEQKKNPRDVAQAIVGILQQMKNSAPQEQKESVFHAIADITVAGSGYINFTLHNQYFFNLLNRVMQEKDIYGLIRHPTSDIRYPTIMVEFAHPNTHKAFHIGHLRNIVTGESIARLLESTGHRVIRANYQGDVGMHIAKAIYGYQMSDIGYQISDATPLEAKVRLLGEAYAAGSRAYEEDEQARKEIAEINKKIYQKDSEVYDIYQETRAWSLEYFDMIYTRVGTKFDRLYFESEVYQKGKEYVEEGLKKGIFVESDGAIIFPGERYGLHNRVFITKEGNPTYEAKEVGLAPLQFSEFHPDQIIHVVGPEQSGYFQVCFAAISQLFPDVRGKEYHLPYGWVRLKHGKMSSRTGQVVLGEWLLDEVKKSIIEILSQNESNYEKEEQDRIAEACAIAAVKYSFLKVGLSQEIAFDIQESVNIHGDSGPYLLYTYARCRSVVQGIDSSEQIENTTINHINFNPEERNIVRLIGYFPEIIQEAVEGFSPSDVARYLMELAKAFNLFYATHVIRGNDQRLLLTRATAQVLKDGLYVLGISPVERM